MPDNKHLIELSVRIRPPSDPSTTPVSVSSSGRIQAGEESFQYPTYVLEGSDQKVAYEALASRLVAALRDGYSCSLLAYGQTGSGKTYSMIGPTGSLTESAVSQSDIPENWGVFPRTMLHILKDGSFGALHASAIEVYQNCAYDLLDNRRLLRVGGTRSKHPIQTEDRIDQHNHPSGCTCRKCFAWRLKEEEFRKKAREKRNFSLPSASRTRRSSSSVENESYATSGETRMAIKTPVDVAKLARTIELTRSAQGHLLNARSSRSHCLIPIYLTSQSSNSVTQRQFLFVDLAGSERIEKSGVTGLRAEEAMRINSSLTTLGRVIKLLGSRNAHIPYRDSTLTMLLRSAFGGKSCTSVLINVSSELDHLNETISSLQFGQRLTCVRNQATVVAGTNYESEVSSLQIEANRLRKELEMMEKNGKGGRFGPKAVRSEIKTFQENVGRFETLRKETRKIQADITEELGKGLKKGSVRHVSLIAKFQKTKVVADNLDDIVFRQKTIRGFWIAPTPHYNKMTAELKQVESKLSQLQGIN